MHRCLAIFLFAALCFQLTAKLGIIAYYQANKEYITARFCENKDKPQMHCKGKCHLKKQLRKAEDTQPSGSNAPSKSQNTHLADFLLPAAVHQQQVFYDVVMLLHYSPYSVSPGIISHSDIFHPPQVIA